jgi:hypothetical protein
MKFEIEPVRDPPIAMNIHVRPYFVTNSVLRDQITQFLARLHDVSSRKSQLHLQDVDQALETFRNSRLQIPFGQES